MGAVNAIALAWRIYKDLLGISIFTFTYFYNAHDFNRDLILALINDFNLESVVHKLFDRYYIL